MDDGNWTPVLDPDDNPDNSPKMKIIFVVLFLFLIGELVYFLYIVPNKKITTTIVPTLTPIKTPEPTKAPTPVSLTGKPQITPLPEYQGKITELNVFKDNPSLATKIEFSFKLDVTSGGIIKPQIIFFDKNELKNLKVIDSTGKVISYQDLKVGQNIKFNQKSLLINVLE